MKTLLTPEQTKTAVYIVQDEWTLRARSRCCQAALYWSLAGWECAACEKIALRVSKELKTGSSILNIGFGKESEFVAEWAGYQEDEIEVSITWE